MPNFRFGHPLVSCSLVWISFALGLEEKAPTPTADYEVREVSGYTVLIHPDVREHPEDLALALEEMEKQFQEIAKALPEKRVKELQEVKIWLEWEVRKNGAAEFHVSADWLKDNGYNADKLNQVEINNTRSFIEWSRKDQPSMILHELGHAYHHRVLGVDDEDVEEAFKKAEKGGQYKKVKHIRGGERKHYALTNKMEYFAELTEAYFGNNDFYPFNREELKKHDPTGYEMIEKSWNRD